MRPTSLSALVFVGTFAAMASVWGRRGSPLLGVVGHSPPAGDSEYCLATRAHSSVGIITSWESLTVSLLGNGSARRFRNEEGLAERSVFP